jgi:hypothetical protein
LACSLNRENKVKTSNKITNARGRHIYEVQQFRDHLTKLEEQAGVSESASRAREGSFIPLRVTNPEIADTDSHFAFEHDAVRRRLRDVYFAVEDTTLRMQLIRAEFYFDDFIRQWRYREIQLLSDYLEELKAASHLRKNAVLIIGMTAVWLWLLGFYGVIGALVFGWLILRTSARDGKNEIAATESELNKAKLYSQGRELWPQTFERGEMLSGDRFTHADDLSAWVTQIQQK